MHTLTLPYPPQANHLFTVIRGRKILSTKGRQYKADVAKTCQVSRIKPLDGNIKLTFTVYRPRKAGDLDNTFKAILDSIKGYAFHDDKQVIEIHAFRDDDKDNPRVEMKVETI